MDRKALEKHIAEKQSVLCVGLDPDLGRLPKALRQTQDPQFQFCRAIIDATHEHAVAYKPNLAFFEAQGAKGMQSLEKVADYLHQNYPHHFTIADAKRGDIGNTAHQYAQAFFERMGFDALTIAPYMGGDSVIPFLERPGKWGVLLALTSNPGAEDFQLLPLSMSEGVPGEALYQRVLERAQEWGHSGNLMFVVGATRPDFLRKVRAIAPDNFLLVPGVGAQGGSVAQVLQHGWGSDGPELLINASRSILFASSGGDFASAAKEAAASLHQEMQQALPKN
jgi:orotidine-5'-phosphate decarboxylase